MPCVYFIPEAGLLRVYVPHKPLGQMRGNTRDNSALVEIDILVCVCEHVVRGDESPEQ